MSDSLNKTIETIMQNIDHQISTKKVVGEPITADGVTVFPIVEVTVGMAAGAFDKENRNNDAGGVGAKIIPTALLVVQNGSTKIVNIKDTDNINKLINMIPDVIDKVLGFIDKNVNKNSEDMPDAGAGTEEETVTCEASEENEMQEE